MVNTAAPYMSPGKTVTFVSAGNLSAQQFTAMAVDASGNVTTATAATTRAIGILLNDPNAASMEAVVGMFGIYPCRAGAAFNEGDALTADGDGELIATTTDKDWVIAIALGAAGAADEIVPCLVGPFGHQSRT